MISDFYYIQKQKSAMRDQKQCLNILFKDIEVKKVNPTFHFWDKWRARKKIKTAPNEINNKKAFQP